MTQVKLTKDHHLVSSAELESGKYDAMIKESFEPLMCSKHGEALRLYCTEPSCSAPICTVCKTTQGHDGHAAIELTEQVLTTIIIVIVVIIIIIIIMFISFKTHRSTNMIIYVYKHEHLSRRTRTTGLAR